MRSLLVTIRACALCALLLSAGAALAASPPPAVEGSDIEAAAKAGLDPAKVAEARAKAAEKRESEASREIDEMLRKAATAMETPAASPPPGSPPRGARKVIYGDIIIHK